MTDQPEISHAQPAAESAASEAPPKRARKRPPTSATPRRKTPSGHTPALDGDGVATASERKRRSPRKRTGADESPAAAEDLQRAPLTRPRRTTLRGRPRESGVLGLMERAQLLTEVPGPPFLTDPLIRALPVIRQALLNRSLDEGVRIAAEELVAAVAPAVAQIWITDLTPWMPPSEHVGGQELAPTLTLRATARAALRRVPPPVGAVEASAPEGILASSPYWPARPDAFIEEVAATRQAMHLFNAEEHPLAQPWRALLPRPPLPPESDAAGVLRPRLGTLAAYPLRARGQFFGVLALGLSARLGPRHMTALEELADLIALATDRDRLLSFSRSQEALAQTVVRHAPVAMAVMTGPEHLFALTNPAFASLLGLDGHADLTGKRLAEIVPDRARGLAASLRLDAVYYGGEPQAMIELPIHLERGMTYWNVTTSPLAGISTSVGGVLVAAVEVTRQVLTRQRAQDTAEVAQERIAQMMTLHATSLDVASQLGADPRELLADILARSIKLLNASAGTVYVRDPRGDLLEVIVSQGLRGDYTGYRIRIGEGLPGQVALTGKGLIVDDYRAYSFRAAIYANEVLSGVIAVPLIHHGQVVGVLDVLDDTERRHFTDDDLWLLDLFAAQAAQAIENARMYVELERAYQKQRELDRMKDDFIATASHELRTPLTGVQGFLDLLLDYSGSRDDELATEFLRKAAESAQELAEIAERLLETSRVDTGRMELHTSAVRIAPVVEEVVRSFRELQQAHGATHELVVDIPPEIYVETDLGRFKEVLENLVGNAIKYSPQGGQVVIRCGAATFEAADDELAAETREITRPLPVFDGALATFSESPTMVLPPLERAETPAPAALEERPWAPSPELVAAARDRRFFMLTVTDQGIGIPATERGRLFGRFSRLASARATQIRGTGLGLYICRQILRAMGGDVWLQSSAPHAGSTFAFALPAAESPTAQSGTFATASALRHAPYAD